MNRQTNKVTVEILGEEYTIKGEADPAYIERLAQFVHQRMSHIAANNPRLSRHKVAVLAALNIADELLRLQGDYRQFLQMLKEEK